MKRVFGRVLLGLLLYLAFLLATAPARWVAEGVARASEGTVTLAQPRGTFWRGAGELHAGGPATGVRHLGTLRWYVNPLWLFVGRAQLNLELDGGTTTQARARLRVGRRLVYVQDLKAQLPAQLVTAIYPPAALFAPTGTIAVQAPSVELSPHGLVAVATASWQGAGARFTGAAALGDYRLELSGRGETATFRLSTLAGNLDLAGEGQWRVTGDGELQFQGTAVPKGEAARLEPLLRSLGRDLGDGRREIRFNARFPLLRRLGF